MLVFGISVLVCSSIQTKMIANKNLLNNKVYTNLVSLLCPTTINP